MTFDEVLTMWREEVIVEDDTAQFGDTLGNRLIRRAATEIAGMLRLLRASDATLTAAIDATSLTPPSGFVNVVKNGLYIRKRRLVLTGMEDVLGKRYLPSGFPLWYSYDPEYGGNIEFAPATKYELVAGDVVLRYAKTYDAGPIAGGTEVWEGKYPEWHHLCALKAGVSAFQVVELYDRAARFEQRYSTELQTFAAVLGRTTVANLMIPREARNDAGSMTQ